MWINSVTTLSLSVILYQCVKERSHLYISKRCAKRSNATLSFANLVCQSVKERFHLHICKCHAKAPKLTLWQIFLTLLNSSAWHWTLFNWHRGKGLTLTHWQTCRTDTLTRLTQWQHGILTRLTTWHWHTGNGLTHLQAVFKAFWRAFIPFVVWLHTKDVTSRHRQRKQP